MAQHRTSTITDKYVPVPVDDVTRRHVIHPIRWESVAVQHEAIAEHLRTINFGIPSVFEYMADRENDGHTHLTYSQKH